MAASLPTLVLLGPTASGKSSLAMSLARQSGGEILSVDSMQVYRHMDIGTAKPSRQDRTEIPHHLIDLVEPDEAFTVARFVDLADGVINRSRVRRTPLIVTGGTPLYYKSLFEGLFDGPPADERLRDELRRLPNEELARRLAGIDPDASSRIHLNDTKRLVRALEVFQLTGQPISSYQTDWAAKTFRHEAVWIGLDWDRDALNRRINARVKSMLSDGWLRETRELLDRYGRLSPTAAEATGYRELISHLEGKTSLEDVVEQIKIATRQLARKQMKWFRRWPQVKWLRGDLETQVLADRVREYWSAG